MDLGVYMCFVFFTVWCWLLRAYQPFPDLVNIRKFSVFNNCMEVATPKMHLCVEATVVVCPMASFRSQPSSETIDAACILTECQIESDERAGGRASDPPASISILLRIRGEGAREGTGSLESAALSPHAYAGLKMKMWKSVEKSPLLFPFPPMPESDHQTVLLARMAILSGMVRVCGIRRCAIHEP